MKYQPAPPHYHRLNAAEKAIQTFKCHFIAGICCIAPTFRIVLWDRLLPKQQLQPTCYACHVSIPDYWHMPKCMSTRSRPNVIHEHLMALMAGTWDQPSIITDATASCYVNVSKYTAEDAATYAAPDLIGAIQKPLPTAPFHNFESKQWHLTPNPGPAPPPRVPPVALPR
eukprot:8686813-Ditylum_brightwellii.AAC.1